MAGKLLERFLLRHEAAGKAPLRTKKPKEYSLEELLTTDVSLKIDCRNGSSSLCAELGPRAAEGNPFEYEPSRDPDSAESLSDQLSFVCQRIFAERELGRLVEILSTECRVPGAPISSPNVGKPYSPGDEAGFEPVTVPSQEILSSSSTTTAGAAVPVRIQRHHRGCERGACCVYSMWNDPAFLGHRECIHRCKSHVWDGFKICGPSLLEVDLPPLDHPCRNGRDPAPNRGNTPPSDSKLCKRDKLLLCKLRKRRYSKTASTVSLDAPCTYNRTPTLERSGSSEEPEHKPKRARTVMSPVQRIRKRMGQRSFGRLTKRPQILPLVSETVSKPRRGL